MDRPSRKTKAVDYSEAFGDDDEDFACVKVPVSKKAKQDHKKPTHKSSSQDSDCQTSSKQRQDHADPGSAGFRRKPLNEKLFDRDLEAALTLSLLQTADSREHPSDNNTDAERPSQRDENTDPSALLRLSNCSVSSHLLGLDDITAEESPRLASRQRNVTSVATERQRSLLKGEEEDYQPSLTPASESDDDFSDEAESEEEEFTVKKKNKISKKDKSNKSDATKRPPVTKKEDKPSKRKTPTKPNPPKAKSQTTAASTTAPSPTVKPASATKKPPIPAVTSVSKPAVSLSPAGGRLPSWNPPGQIGRSPSSSQNAPVRSPVQGLRLGLSRRIRIKPLHPNIADRPKHTLLTVQLHPLLA